VAANVHTPDSWREYAEHPAEGGAAPDSKPNGAAKPKEYELVPVDAYLEPGKAPEYIVHGLFEMQSAVGLVAPPESGKSLFMQEIAVCVSLGEPFHGRKCGQGLVVYLVGEGQHGLRARFQALETRYPRMRNDVAALVISKAPASFLDLEEVERVRVAIAKAIDHYKMPLRLLIIDTLARFIGSGDESKAQDMGSYLWAVDYLRGEASSVSLHHPGHEGTRGRGSSSWRAALDAEYSLAKNENNVVTVTCQKMKDGEKPEPFSFSIVQARTLMQRDDGSPVSSALLVPTDVQPVQGKATGKGQKQLLALLEALPSDSIWTEEEMRQIGRDAGMHRNTARDAVLGLRQLGYFELTVAGSRLARHR
jgi:hypothetical protein